MCVSVPWLHRKHVNYVRDDRSNDIIARASWEESGVGGAEPEQVHWLSFYLLEHMDVSRKPFVGPFLLALLSVQYLSIAGNRFTQALSDKGSCWDNLRLVDLMGSIPPTITILSNQPPSIYYCSHWICNPSDSLRFLFFPWYYQFVCKCSFSVT